MVTILARRRRRINDRQRGVPFVLVRIAGTRISDAETSLATSKSLSQSREPKARDTTPTTQSSAHGSLLKLMLEAGLGFEMLAW
jgi:hypothetical protein